MFAKICSKLDTLDVAYIANTTCFMCTVTIFCFSSEQQTAHNSRHQNGKRFTSGVPLPTSLWSPFHKGKTCLLRLVLLLDGAKIENEKKHESSSFDIRCRYVWLRRRNTNIENASAIPSTELAPYKLHHHTHPFARG